MNLRGGNRRRQVRRERHDGEGHRCMLGKLIIIVWATDSSHSPSSSDCDSQLIETATVCVCAPSQES